MAAQVSGPGKFAKRTDTGGQPIRELPNAKYGEAKQFREAQQAAPLAQADGMPPAPPASAMAPAAPQGSPAAPQAPVKLPGLFDTGNPDIPVTAGAPRGAGPNAIRGLPPGMGEDFNPTALKDAIEPYVAADPSGVLRDTIYALSERGLW